MKARYYEPSSGRFISEDQVADGKNWFIYCGNDPLNRIDEGGQKWKPSDGYAGFCAFMVLSSQFWAVVCVITLKANMLDKAVEAAGISMSCAGAALGVTNCPLFVQAILVSPLLCSAMAVFFGGMKVLVRDERMTGLACIVATTFFADLAALAAIDFDQ